MRKLIPALDRYEAAIRLERARQIVREAMRYGFPVTSAHVSELRGANDEYTAATAMLRG